MRQRKFPVRLVAAIAAVALLAASCGDDEDDAAASADTGESEAEAPETEAPVEHLSLTMGGTQSSSSAFAMLSAMARLAGEADGDMTIKIRETGTSHENIQLLGEGAIEFGLAGLRTPTEAAMGLAQYEGSAVPELCTVMNFAVNAEYLTVTEDAGVDTLADLEGEPFAPGFQGSGLYDSLQYWLSVIDIELDVFTGGLEDVINAMKDRRIIGFGKSAAGFRPDASMLDVQSSIDVKAIGFTTDDVDKIMADDPLNKVLYQFEEVPPGSIYDNEEPFLTSIVTTNLFADTNQDQDAIYRLTKALWETLPEAAEQANYEGAKGVTPEQTTKTAEMLQICPGSQRYYDEIA